MRTLIAVAAVLTLSACTTTENADWVMSGGSKAGGEVVLEIDVPAKFGFMETNINWDIQQANAEAERRCKNWGYTGADMYRKDQFPVRKVCHAMGYSPCWSKEYYVQYQCTGGKN